MAPAGSNPRRGREERTGYRGDGRDDDHGRRPDEADVFLDVPTLNVEKLDLEVQNLRAHIAARAELAGFLKIDVGVDAYLDEVKLEIEGVEARVSLEVKLERILGTIEQALKALESNPGLLAAALGEAEENTRAAIEGPRASEESPGPADGENPGVEATDAARRVAAELGMDLSGIQGTGSGGRVLLRDVRKAAG